MNGLAVEILRQVKNQRTFAKSNPYALVRREGDNCSLVESVYPPRSFALSSKDAKHVTSLFSWLGVLPDRAHQQFPQLFTHGGIARTVTARREGVEWPTDGQMPRIA
jgi:hypothetical protein